MELTELSLNELPNHLDIALFFAMSVGVAFVLSVGVKKLSNAMLRTDHLAARNSMASSTRHNVPPAQAVQHSPHAALGDAGVKQTTGLTETASREQVAVKNAA